MATEDAPAKKPAGTGMLPPETQVLIRLERVDGRLDGVEQRLDDLKELVMALGSNKISEKCLDLVQAFVTGPNVRWFVIGLLGLAAIGNGVVMAGYGITLGKADAAEEAP